MTFLLFYTDPGSGMMLLQILLAFVASGLFYFRKYFTKIFGKGAPADQLESSEIGSDSAVEDETRLSN